jgi:hypothetical protein
MNKVRKIQESESVEKGLPRFVQPRNSPHSYMARPSYPTTAMGKATQNQLPAAAPCSTRQQIKNRWEKKPIRERAGNGAGVTFTGHEVRQWRQTSRESATEEIRDTESEGAAKALPQR